MMINHVWKSQLLSSTILGMILIVFSPFMAKAQVASDDNNSPKVNETNQLFEQLDKYSQEGGGNSFNQVTNVNQLRDVSPDSWAFEALRSLVDRYGCIVGYPDQTYRGNKSLSRYEFAAGLNACLNQIERLIASSEAVLREDIDTINRLLQEFEAELATLSGRVDNLESRTAFLEDHQFSTTTKLKGEVVFGLAQEFTSDNDNQAVFQDRVRLGFVSSFTGRDSLLTRLDASNAQAFNGVENAATTYQTKPNDNDIEIGKLAYYFPIGDQFDFYIPVDGGIWQDFVPTVSPYLDGFTGATAALSSFGESSPIYKIGLPEGGGLGFNYKPIDRLTISAGYFGDQSFDPSQGNGLFNGDFAALGQITFDATDNIQLAATYVRGYFQNRDTDLSGVFNLNVGTPGAINPLGGRTVTTDSVGLQASWTLLDSRLALNAFGMWTQANAVTGSSDSDIWSYGLGIAMPDLWKEGNLAGIIAGVQPYEGGVDNNPVHVEGFYKYQLNDNISVTPGLIWISKPNGDSFEKNGLVGVVRTTFTF